MSKLAVISRIIKTKSLVLGALFVSACMSGGPATKYYTLFADKSIQPLEQGIAADISLGIGPIVLPDYLENPSIVSVSDTQRVIVSGYHAWAGDLKDGVSRVITDNLSSYYSSSNIWSFPWDVRTRPQYQVRIEFLDLSGVRGKDLQLKAKWSLIDHEADALLAIGQSSYSQKMEESSYDAYVAALNITLHRMSQTLADEIQQTLMQTNASGVLNF